MLLQTKDFTPKGR